MLLLLVALIMAAANGATLRTPVRNTACQGTTGRETYLLWADLLPNEYLRAVDANLVVSSGSSLVLNSVLSGGQAPVPPTLPAETCASYVSWGRVSSGTDLTWITPDFKWSSSGVSKGWFLSDPSSSQQPSGPGGSILIAQLTVQASATGACVEGPKISGTVILITNGTVQQPGNVCAGSGCTAQTTCELITGYVVPSMQQPASSAAPNMAYHLVRSGFAPIPIDMTLISGRPTIARRATVGLAPAAAGSLIRRAFQLDYLTDGSESRVWANVTQARSVLVTVVRATTGSSNQCTATAAAGTVRDRRYSASVYIASITRGQLTLSVAPVSSAVIDISSFPNDFNLCGNVDYLVTQAVGPAALNYQHRIHMLGFTTVCGRVASAVGTVPQLGSWSVYSDAATCDNVEAVINGLLHQFGLGSSDAQSGQTVYSHGDGACILGRTSTAEGTQRRSLNALHMFNWGALPQANMLRASLAPNVQRLYSATYPGSEPVVQLIDLSLEYFIIYRSASDPGIDRQANFAQAAANSNPLSLPSYTGRVLIYRRIADGSTRLLGSLGLNEIANPSSVIEIRVNYLDRYSAQLMIQRPSPPLAPAITAPPASGSAFVDTLPGDVAMHSSYNHDFLTSYSDMPLLNLGINGNDADPYVFVRLRVPVPRFSLIGSASLLLETSSRQTLSTAGSLYLEVAVETADNSAALTAGSNLLGRAWSQLRVATVVSTTQYHHDEISLDVTHLLQQAVERSGWQANQYVTFRIRNDPSRPLSAASANRIAYSGVLCGHNYNGGSYPCGPRLAASYSQRTTSSTALTPSSYSLAIPEPLSFVFNADDGQSNTLQETGSVPHVVQIYTFAPIIGVTAATLTVRARVSGAETFQVQYQRSGSWLTLMSFTPSDSATVTKTANVPLDGLLGPTLQIRLQDVQTSTAAASALIVDQIALATTFYNVDCILAAPGRYSRCPPCVLNPQSCAERPVVSARQGSGAACSATTVCRACTASACPRLAGTVTISALVSVDSQQQWQSVQTSDPTAVQLFSIPGIPNAQIGVAGKALLAPGSTLMSGFWVGRNFNAVAGVTQCLVRDVVLSCPSGDASGTVGSGGALQGSIVCRNGRIPGPTTPATATFTVECT